MSDVDTSGFTPCGESAWVKSTNTIGVNVGTYLQVEPTDAARIRLRWTQGGYDEMWADIARCTHLEITPSQQNVLYQQMVCHAVYGLTKQAGGNTWDLEAWRREQSAFNAINPFNRCGQAYGDVDAGSVANFLRGRIVSAWSPSDPSPRRSWLLDDAAGSLVRRHLPTVSAFNCARSKGHPGATWFSFAFLDEYVPATGADFTDSECSTPEGGVASPSPATPRPTQGPTATPPPTPPTSTRGFTIQDSYLGGTWARSDPNNGTWYSKGNRPANGAYWYPNNLGVAVDCARRAANYTVAFFDGRRETWNVWFHVTDGKWYPAAATSEVWVNDTYGLRAC